MKDAKPPCIEPTVGTQLSGSTSTFKNIFTKWEVSFFNSGIPWISGYVFATPF